MSTPFKMKGFSGFGNSSPLHSEKYVARQLKKAERLEKRAEKREKKAEEPKANTKEKYGEESLFLFQPSGKRARKRSEKAREKAAAGSRKAYRKLKRENMDSSPLTFGWHKKHIIQSEKENRAIMAKGTKVGPKGLPQ